MQACALNNYSNMNENKYNKNKYTHTSLFVNKFDDIIGTLMLNFMTFLYVFSSVRLHINAFVLLSYRSWSITPAGFQRGWRVSNYDFCYGKSEF